MGGQAGHRNPRPATGTHRGPPRDSGALPGGVASGRRARSAAGLPLSKLGGPGRRHHALGQGRRRRPGLDRSSDVEYRGRGDPPRLPGTRGEWGLGRGRVGLVVGDAAGRTPRRSNLDCLGELGGDAVARRGGSRPSRKSRRGAGKSIRPGGYEAPENLASLRQGPGQGLGGHAAENLRRDFVVYAAGKSKFLSDLAARAGVD